MVRNPKFGVRPFRGSEFEFKRSLLKSIINLDKPVNLDELLSSVSALS